MTVQPSQLVTAAFIQFLRKQSISEDLTESVEVAIQCLTEAFSLTDKTLSDGTLPDLLTLVSATKPASVPATDKDRAEAEEHKTQGNAFVATKKPAQAVECYTRAINLDPSSAVYFCNRAAAYTMLEEHEKAREDAKVSIQLNPAYSKAHHRLGKAHLALGELEEAMGALERALELEPEDAGIKATLDQVNRAVSTTSGKPSGMPNLPGGFPMPDAATLGSFMKNPAFMKAAQEMMQNGTAFDFLKQMQK